MKKVLLNGRLCSVSTISEYTDMVDVCNPKFTAIETEDNVLPIKNKTDEGPGVYYVPGGMCCRIVDPTEEEKDKYSKENIIDYSKCETIGDVIQKENLVRDIENELLTNKDDIFQLSIGVDDTPEMIATKLAINAKNADVKQYEPRFDQFQNDMRLLKGKSITLAKMKSIYDKFDIEAELILRDREGCANPMNKEIKMNLTRRD